MTLCLLQLWWDITGIPKQYACLILVTTQIDIREQQFVNHSLHCNLERLVLILIKNTKEKNPRIWNKTAGRKLLTSPFEVISTRSGRGV